MKRIFENKVYGLVMAFIMTLSTGVLFQSCSNEYEDSSATNTKLELLINSSEYTKLSKNLTVFGRDMKSMYATLSDVDKNKVIDVFAQMSDKSISQQQLDRLFEDFNSLCKVDLKAKINDFNGNIAELNKFSEINDIPKRDLILEIEKSKYRNTLPRLKDGNESDFNDCMDSCAITCAASLLFCIGPQAAPCAAGVMAVYALCCLLC